MRRSTVKNRLFPDIGSSRSVASALCSAPMRLRLCALPAALVALSLVAGCSPAASPAPAQYGQGYSTGGQYAPQGQYPSQGQYPPQGQYPSQGQYPPPGQYQTPGQYPPPGQYAPPGQYPPPVQPAPSTQPGFPLPTIPTVPGLPVFNDPINVGDINYLRGNASQVLVELVAALAPAPQAKVKGIPLTTDPSPGEVNAYAGCDDQGLPLMAVTDGLLQVEAYIAQFKATDEIFGTKKLDTYLQYMAQNQRPKQPIVPPPPGLVDPTQNVDGRKVARQHQLMDEQLAFVLGHELGHHHLGHTGCANGQSGSRGITSQDLGRALSRAVPLFNQPNEIAADVAGTNNLLSAGARRQGYHWNEQGALLTLDFFARLEQLTPGSLIFGFTHSHPNPVFRRPFVLQTASSWRSTGGTGWQFPTLPNIFGG